MKLAICAIIKNEGPNLDEWLAFHSALGVEHFYIYDNGSADNGAEILAKWSDVVTVTHWPQHPGQLSAYRDCVAKVACDWLACIDVDEFIFPVAGASLHAAMEPYASYGAVGVHWMTFGPSGHETRPGGLAIESYTLRGPDAMGANRHVKSVIQTRHVKYPRDPHHWEMQDGSKYVDELGRRLTGPEGDVTHAHLRINHYFTRSRAEWMAKVAKGRADTPSHRHVSEMEGFESMEVEDCSAVRFAARTRELMRGK